jgi:hypothetical protein
LQRRRSQSVSPPSDRLPPLRHREPNQRSDQPLTLRIERGIQRANQPPPLRHLKRRVALPHLAQRHAVSIRPVPPASTHSLGQIQDHRRTSAPQLRGQLSISASNPSNQRLELLNPIERHRINSEHLLTAPFCRKRRSRHGGARSPGQGRRRRRAKRGRSEAEALEAGEHAGKIKKAEADSQPLSA